MLLSMLGFFTTLYFFSVPLTFIIVAEYMALFFVRFAVKDCVSLLNDILLKFFSHSSTHRYLYKIA